MNLKFNVIGQELKREDNTKIAGFTRGFNHVVFNFDFNWINLNKYVLFTEPDKTKHVVELGYGKVLSAPIPNEVLQNPIFYISVFADDLFTTIEDTVIVAPSGYINDLDDLDSGSILKGDSTVPIFNHRKYDDEYFNERRNRFEKQEHPYV